jgi:hypothetical protein
MLKTSSLEVMSIGFLGFSVFVESDSCPLLDLLFSVICLSYTIGANVLQLPEGRDFKHKINLER